MKPLHELSIAEAGAQMRAGTLTSLALTGHALARIAEFDPRLHAFITVTEDRALRDAARADQALRAGIDLGPMHGIPYGLKDIFDTAGIRTTCNSWLMENHVPREDCEVESRLRAGGAVLLGKLNTHEFALGGPSPELPFPPARNPWNPAHSPGASSSGSGAAVAAGLVHAALGSDTSGSVRSPACHCGVVGLKPTYGRVSRRGAFPLSYALDHNGPLAWTVEDCALVMQVVAGHDPLDPASADVPVPDFTAGIGRDLSGLRIGYARRFFAGLPGLSPEVLAAVDGAAGTLAEMGATVSEAELPSFDLFNACGRVIMAAESYAIHEQDLRERPERFGRYTYQRIIPGAALTAADLVQAFRLRRELAEAVNGPVLDRFDALVCATALSPPARFADFGEHWPPPAAATATLTIPFNVTGNPALSVPAGFSRDGLPLGVQIVGRFFDELTVLRIGAAYQAATGLAARRAPMSWARADPGGGT